MAQFFSDEFIQEVTDKNDILSVVSQYVNLKRSGSTLKGLCPFHKEKTPSFSVSPDKQLYYCFGCGKGGTVIHFIMQLEHLDFVDAVTYLAEKAGMAIPDSPDNKRSDNSRLKQLIYKINADAGRFFYDQLMAPQGKAALEYAFRRGMTQGTLNRFGVGFAPEGNHLIAHLTQKGYSEEELLASGVAGKNESGRLYDRFRNRLMFPIIDVRKNVIGFGGRVMGDGMPKYLNSPETIAFSKSHNLFGLNFAKATKDDFLLLVEGYMDVIALHQNGVISAVATLGTALTPEQARILKRCKGEVIIAYDSDQAGQNATKRAIQLLTDEGLVVRVLTMEGCKDPDEYMVKNGAGAFRALIDKSQLQIEYKINKLKEKYDITDLQQKVDYVNEAAKEFAGLKSPVERELYVKQLAEETGVSADSIFSEIKRLHAVAQNTKRLTGFPKAPAEVAVRMEDSQERLLRQSHDLLLHLMCYHEDVFQTAAQVLTAQDFPPGVRRQLFEQITAAWQAGKPPDGRVLMSQLQDGEVAAILHDDNNVTGNHEAAAQDAVSRILARRNRQELLEAIGNQDLSQQQRLEEMERLLQQKQDQKKGGTK